jgi:hypothetical protein
VGQLQQSSAKTLEDFGCDELGGFVFQWLTW